MNRQKEIRLSLSFAAYAFTISMTVVAAAVFVTDEMPFVSQAAASAMSSEKVTSAKEEGDPPVSDQEPKPFHRTDWRDDDRMGLAMELLADGMGRLETEIDISEARLPVSLMRDTYGTLIDQDPRLWHVTGDVSYLRQGDVVLSVSPTYLTDDIDRLEEMREEYEEGMEELLAHVPDDADDIAKVLAIHDALISRCSYNRECAESGDAYDITLTDNPWGAWSAVVGSDPVCRGYALAFKDACDREGITCETVRTTTHAWNKVLLDGSWFNVDVTFDDADGRVNRHEMCLKSDGYMSAHDENGHHDGMWPDWIEARDTSYDDAVSLWSLTQGQQ